MASISDVGVSTPSTQLITTVPYNYKRHFFQITSAIASDSIKLGTVLYGFTYGSNPTFYVFDAVNIWSKAVCKIGMPPSAEAAGSQIVVKCRWRVSGLSWNSYFDNS